jgi:hypothetical protein
MIDLPRRVGGHARGMNRAGHSACNDDFFHVVYLEGFNTKFLGWRPMPQ